MAPCCESFATGSMEPPEWRLEVELRHKRITEQGNWSSGGHAGTWSGNWRGSAWRRTCARPPLAQSKTVLWEGRAQAQSLVFEASVALAKDLGAPAAVITKASNLWKHDGPLQPVL